MAEKPHENPPASNRGDMPVNLAPQAPGEVLSTMEVDGSRRWMKPTPVFGPWWKRRSVIGWALIVLYIAAPIIPINGKPAIWLNVLGREFTILGHTFYAYDTVSLVLFLISTIVLIVLATSLLGRAWCGWACPQTVYMEFVYRPVEQWLEGPQGQKLRRLSTAGKAARKGAKWTIFLLISLVLAHTFVAYFASWEALLRWMVRPPGENLGFFALMAATTALVMIDFAFYREQMCTIACPYARFQSVLLDPNSLIVSYDPGRGEPRGRRTRAQRQQEAEGVSLQLGDCIECGACVRCCPTGIDIRDGLQMECIGCTQCIDACDEVMIKVNKPIGLIRYTSEVELEGGRTRFLRPRVIAYTVVIAVAVAALASVIASHDGVNIAVTRASAEPFMELRDGTIANRLGLRLQNRTSAPVVLRIEAVEPADASVQMVGPPETTLDPGEMKRTQALVSLPREAFAHGNLTAHFRAVAEDGTAWTFSHVLLGPSPGSASIGTLPDGARGARSPIGATP